MSASLRDKLEAMAARGTEHERAAARAKLAGMDARIPPPPPHTRNGAPSPDPAEYGSEIHFYGPNGEHIMIRGVHVSVTKAGTTWTTSTSSGNW